jgi:hypothetical protein
MRRDVLGLIVLSLIAVSCSTPRRAPSEAGETRPAEPYVRITSSDSNHVALQIAARQFLPTRRGEPEVWLTGVSHLGDSNYYAALQAHLDAQSLVLFEGVGGGDAEADAQDQPSPSTNASNGASNNAGSLQSAMAAALGLVFQLDAIDYQRPNFRHSDLSVSQLRQLILSQQTSPGQPGASESFEDLLSLMEGNSWFDWLIQATLRFLGASPKFQALGRLALIDLLGQIQGDPSRLEGLPPELDQLLHVLLERRNEKVVADLKSELPRFGPHSSIAVFFGTGHMPDLQKRLTTQLQFRPGKEVWFTAFAVDLARANVSAADRAFVDNFVQWQLAHASAHAGK